MKKGKYELLNIDGEKYPIAYNYNVLEVLQAVWGTWDAWSWVFEDIARDEFGNLIEDKENGIQVTIKGKPLLNDDGSVFLAKKKEIQIKDIAETFKIFINEGIYQYNKDAIEKMQDITHRDACELLSYIDGKKSMMDLVIKANMKSSEEEGEPKNAQTEQSL